MAPETSSLSSSSKAKVDVVDRAIELASSGLCKSVNHVRQALIREGFTNVGEELKGPSINRQLIALLQHAKEERSRAVLGIG